MSDSRPPSSAGWREAASPGGALDPIRFRAQVMTTFPELLTEIARLDAANVHEQARSIGRYIERGLGLCDEAALRKAFEFVASAIENGSPEVRNAIEVSLLETLTLPAGEVDRRWALSLMPASLESAWRSAQALRERMFEDPH